jgi:uncharacterized iron-regulated membrane protein
MLTARSVKTWSWLHKWSSLVCTAFMLLLCLTGLPLIFHHEIGHLTGVEVEAPKMPKGTPHLSLDRVLEVARARHPDCVVQFSSPDDESPDIWFVTLTPTPAPTDDFRSVAVDARTGQVLAQPRFDQGFMWVMLKLHVDLFAGLAGQAVPWPHGPAATGRDRLRCGAVRAVHAQTRFRRSPARPLQPRQVAGSAQPPGAS